MKVVAIKDAPTRKDGYYHNGVKLNKTYYKGDIFELKHSLKLNGHYIIWHDKLGAKMEVNSNNFIDLDQFREEKINTILDI